MSERSDIFAKLHEGPRLLILPNAWDPGSARIIEHAGAKAIATSSSACAWARGYPDGEALPAEEVLALIASIARSVSIPVSADIETAYAEDAGSAARFVERVLDAAAVGINIEDGVMPPDLLVRKIDAIRAMAARKNHRLWINARTDVYLKNLASGEAAFSETVARADRYGRAGADSIFVPGIADPALIERLVHNIPLPLNVLAWPNLPDASALEKLGVRRLSAGGGVARGALGYTHRLATDFLATGRSSLFSEGPAATLNLNQLMRGGP